MRLRTRILIEHLSILLFLIPLVWIWYQEAKSLKNLVNETAEIKSQLIEESLRIGKPGKATGTPPDVQTVLKDKAEQIRTLESHIKDSIGLPQRLIIFATALGIIWCFLLAFFASKIAVAKISRFKKMALEVSGGNFDQIIPEEGVREYKELAEELNKMAQSLKEAREEVARQQEILIEKYKLAVLGEMAGGIAHEINSPLAAITNTSRQMQEVLEEDPVDKTLLKEMAGRIDKTALRMVRIISGLRAFIREGRADPFSTVSVLRLLEETISYCKEKLSSNGIKVTIKCGADVKADLREAQISQVLVNLISNSADAVAGLKQKWISIEAQYSGTDLEIRCRDSGTGIPPELHENIFKAFFTTKSVGKGTGIGLSVSRRIVEAHGGKVYVDPDDPNTCFLIRLPARQGGKSNEHRER